ncbi:MULTISPECIES: hypothetical protein, partial [Lonsdalea]
RYEADIIRCILNAGIEKYVKPVSMRAKRKFNKELYTSPEFEKLWSAISQKTTYRVTVKRPMLIEACIKAIKAEPRIQPLRIDVTRAGGQSVAWRHTRARTGRADSRPQRQL